jgi:hypothetical protein
MYVCMYVCMCVYDGVCVNVCVCVCVFVCGLVADVVCVCVCVCVCSWCAGLDCGVAEGGGLREVVSSGAGPGEPVGLTHVARPQASPRDEIV